VWLDCPFEVSLERVRQASHRPLARDPEAFARLYEARREAYSRAEFRIAIESDDPRVAVDAIASLPIFE
ncbi:MAG: shikimate kinase, partial [Acidobacteria bacterium]|nr:shikimate kinase [Acidobacteriota bacterium]